MLTFDNVFRNENMYREGSTTAEGEQKNIRPTGVGNAVIDGGIHNGLTENTSKADGMPHVSRNNMILLHNVDGKSPGVFAPPEKTLIYSEYDGGYTVNEK